MGGLQMRQISLENWKDIKHIFEIYFSTYRVSNTALIDAQLFYGDHFDQTPAKYLLIHCLSIIIN
jgi:hypothetical protein